MNTSTKQMCASLLMVALFAHTNLSQAKINQQHVSLSSVHGSGIEFIENKGQVIDMRGDNRPDILYVGEGGGSKVYMQSNRISYVYAQQKQSGVLSETTALSIYRIDMEFAGANPKPLTSTTDPTDGVLNYYLPQCPGGITNVKGYNKLMYHDVYNKIDVSFNGTKEQGLEYDFIVKPGANVNDIKLKYSGQESLELRNNKLYLITKQGELEEYLPKVYQNINGQILTVACAYKLQNGLISFNIPTYNTNYNLIIDPWVSYYGGSGDEVGTSIATDNTGNSVITGYTSSVNFPVTAGFQATLAGSTDAFVVKFNSAGIRLWATYYGGSGADQSTGIATDVTGNIVLTGSTASGNLPVQSGGFQMILGGGIDAFIVKFTSAGTLLWASYYGGSSNEVGNGITTDNAGNMAITGSTGSTDLPVGASVPNIVFQAVYDGGTDAFVVKFDPNGNRLWSTYYGGSNNDTGNGIVTDNAGNIAITGSTGSTDFPVLAAGGYSQAMGGGGTDAFAVKFDPTGVRQWATYYGGSNTDAGNGIATDNTGNIIITGTTASSNLPVQNGFQSTLGGNTDAFVLKFNLAGTRLWATYLGGDASEIGHSLVADGNSNIYVYGDFEGGGAGNYPVSTCAYQPIYGGPGDNFIAKYNAAGQQHCFTYMGGSTNDVSGGIALYGNSLYITGTTAGAYPVTAGAFQTAYGGGTSDAFVSSLCTNICESRVLGLNLTANATNVCLGTPVTFLATVSNSCDTTGYKYKWTFPGGSPSSSTVQNPQVTYLTGGIYDVKLVVTTTCKSDSITKAAYIVVSTCGLSVLARDTNICSGVCASLIAKASGGTAPYIYKWSTGATTQTISACPVTNTTYTVTVTDATALTSTTTPKVMVATCNLVWPGDADENTIANNYDLLAVGLGYSVTGPIRTNANITWTGQSCNDWASALPAIGVNEKYADCNGDGVIDLNDTTAIIQNYGLTHALKLARNPVYNTSIADLYLKFPMDTTYTSSVISIPVYLGNGSISATNVYGLAFSINYDPNIVDTSKVSFKLNSNLWLGNEGVDVISIHKNLSSKNQLDVGITRINHISISGSGQIGTCDLVLKDDLIAKVVESRVLNLFVSLTKVISNDGTEIPVNNIGDSVVVVQQTLTGIKSSANSELKTLVYPNPATNQLNVILNGNTALTTIKLVNTIGQVVYETVISENKTMIDLGAVNKGVYMLNIVNTNGVTNQRVCVVK